MVLPNHLKRFLLVLLLILMFAGCASSEKPPVAKNGFLDLSTWDFAKDGVVNLNGQWEFYWKQLLSPVDLQQFQSAKNTDYFQIPGRWDGRVIDGTKQNGDGYATFHLTVKVAPGQRILAVRIRDESSAYQLWINGTEVARNGVVGATLDSMVPQYLLQVKPFLADSEILEFVLHVSNFQHRKGGVWLPIEVGDAQNIVARQDFVWALDLFVFGSLLVMGLYYLLVFLLRRKEYSVLYFAIFCLLMAVRTLFVNSRFFVYVFPSFPWNIAYIIELITVTAIIPVMLMFICSLYPAESSKYVVRFFQALGLAASLFVLFTKAKLSSCIVVPYQFVIFFLFAYLSYVLWRAAIKKRAGAGIILFGIIVLYLTFVNDVLASQGIISTPYFASIGMLFLVLSQSFCLSKRFVDAFALVENLTVELEEINIELTRKDKIKDEFLANTSHELRTPLSGIIGLTESLQSGAVAALSPQGKDTLAMIVSSARRLDCLVNDILDLSRLKNRDIQLNRVAVELYSLVDVALAVSRPLTKGKPLQLRNAIPAGIPPVFADENRLLQILFNLIGNAIKFTDDGQIVVSAEVDEGQLQIRVIDSGIGISETEQDRIFLSFEQVDSSETRRFGGSGLGLSITKQLIELHGGRIWVESQPGRGACFCFLLPIFQKEPELSSAELSVEAEVYLPSVVVNDLTTDYLAPAVADHAPRILIVDDEPINLQVACNHLSLAGMAVETAPDGVTALQLIEQNPPDLVLLDLMMPKLNGYDVCRRLRRDFSTTQLPVIMLTARHQIADLVEGFEAGANDYLTKPFWREELVARVKSQLKLKEAFATLQDNIRLKKELAARKATERELRLTQLRLSELLYSVDDALLAVKTNGEVSFCNRACEVLLGYATCGLLGQNIRTLVNSKTIELLRPLFNSPAQSESSGKTISSYPETEFKTLDNTTVCAELMVTSLELDDELHHVFIVRQSITGDTRPPSVALTVVEELNRNRQRLNSLEISLNEMLPMVAEKVPGFVQNMRLIDNALEQVGQSLLSNGRWTNIRHLTVEALTLATDYWAESTNTTKIDLARESGLWKVYTNPDGSERSQTLDRYLDIKSVPLKPRLKSVFQTIDFVLMTCSSSSLLRNQLEISRNKLRAAR